MKKRATATDRKRHPLPAETATLPFRRTFTATEIEQIEQGFIPQQMEDKWFMYYQDGQLNLYRSWTGFHIYQVTIEPGDDNNYQVTKVLANRNPQQYNMQDNEHDAQLLHFYIDLHLLHRKISFPTPNDLTREQQDIYQHSLVGRVTTAAPAATISSPTRFDRIAGCLILGAVGDSLGSFYEGRGTVQEVNFNNLHGTTDDTQLTLATCEAIIKAGRVTPDSIAARMLSWYNSGRLTGLGASTLKALRDLQVGAHWALAGRTGEYAAGNGAAMRIAPLGFFVDPDEDRTLIKDVCNITHKNDEAFTGSLAILYALHYIIQDKWPADQSLITCITPHLPDTGVRDNLLLLEEKQPATIADAAKLVGTAGHVVQSVPFALFAAQQIRHTSIENIFTAIIQSGGDTDTNASMAGQLMGAWLGIDQLRANYYNLLDRLPEIDLILETANNLSQLTAT
ncbi:ADP-ribosylglycohydrolase family protein [Paraflavitalea pollutisoli]|uniref:ADP-ribosylglycohydrolase family protein n=1 Tax=Paraflavitalea pollutisoli TaxID=3034143 RepID=UPI0023EAE15F|nr:ADP-ribosylglycohydrolase family protein [Paraflavitalea sp. H1-2-19X]